MKFMKILLETARKSALISQREGTAFKSNPGQVVEQRFPPPASVERLIFAPVKFAKIALLDNILFVELSKIHEVINMDRASGLGIKRNVIVYGDSVIPLVDYRGRQAMFKSGISPAIIFHIGSRLVCVLVDMVMETIEARFADIRMPSAQIASEFGFLEGLLYDADLELHVIDMEKLLGPALRAHGKQI